MEENYLFGLLVFVFFGIVAFIKPEKAKREVKRKQEASSYNKSSDVSVSGVAKYLQEKNAAILQSSVTGVAKYLQEKEVLNIVKDEELSITGVAKYLATQEQAPASGVSRYMAKQAVYAKQIAAENVSGVEKYLKNRN